MNKKLLATGAVAAMLMSSTAANAASILYRNDFNVGTDYVAQALTGIAATTTAISGDLSGSTLTDFDIVIYANQNSGVPAGDIAALDAYITGGGKVIFQNWTSGLPSLDSALSGNNNETDITLSMFDTGVGTSLTAVNPGWGTFTTGLTNAGGTVAATFGNGDAAIIVGNGGNTIHNGFLTDTVDASQLYVNQINSLGVAAVPEPGTWAMMILGFGLVGGALRTRRRKTKVSFAF